MDYRPDWSRVVRSTGYLAVWCPEHPHAWKQGFIYVHRVVMEQKIGRLLERGEHVHHINEDRHDNRIENLEVLSNSEHARKHGLQRGRAFVSLLCPTCRRSFTRERRHSHFTPSRATGQTFCSRQCSGKYGARIAEAKRAALA